MTDFLWKKREKLNEQLKFFKFKSKRFISVYANKPRIRVDGSVRKIDPRIAQLAGLYGAGQNVGLAAANTNLQLGQAAALFNLHLGTACGMANLQASDFARQARLQASAINSARQQHAINIQNAFACAAIDSSYE